MPSYRVTVAYDGTDFVGWQRQASGTSIQGVLEAALRSLDERDVSVVAAGRTDAGVHALGQVAAFTLAGSHPADTVARALNARLPATVRIVAASEVRASFHPQFDARSKTYRYRIWNAEVMNPFERRYAWHLPGALDLDAMRSAARLVEGEHDFAAFQSAGADVATSIRDVAASSIVATAAVVRDAAPEAGWSVSGKHDRIAASGGERRHGLVTYEITGSGFLRHMVRAIVGSLVEVGRGRQPVEWISRVLASRDRSAAGQTAPALGLFLVRVEYSSIEPAVAGRSETDP